MTKRAKSKSQWIWLAVLILFIGVAASTVALTARLNDYILDDSGAVSLTGEDKEEKPSEPSREEEEGPVGSTAGAKPSAPAASSVFEAMPSHRPGFEASDGQSVWTTDTRVEIFRVSYENGEGKVFVQGADGNKVIAPGAGNSYTFKLKNTGNVAMDYVMEVDAFVSPSDLALPITARISRYDSRWVLGSGEEYAPMASLDTVEDTATLGAGKYTYYTLDWLWPFEDGDDGLDTLLGDRAEKEDLVFTVVIRTYATESDDPNAGGGLTPPQTGDDPAFLMWIVLAVVSFFFLLLLLWNEEEEKKKRRAKAKADALK